MDKIPSGVKKCVINGQSVDDLNCSICHDVFKNPRLLRCCHSFCMKCILDYIKGQGQSQRNSTGFYCPLCRKSMYLPGHFFGANNIREDDVESVFPKNISLANAIDSLSVEQEFCPKHPNKIFEYFCKDHLVLSCSKCAMKTHRLCRHVVDLDECTTETLNDMLQNSQSQLTESCKTFPAKLRSLIAFKTKLLNSLESMKQDIDGIIADGRKGITEKTNQETAKVAKMLLQCGTPPGPVHTNTRLNKRSFVIEMQQVTSKQAQVDACNRTKFGTEGMLIYESIIRDLKANLKRKIDSVEEENIYDSATKFQRISSLP